MDGGRRDSSTMEDLVLDLAELAHARMARDARYLHGEAALEQWRDYFRTGLAEAEGVHLLRREGVLQAAVIDWPDPESWFGAPTQVGFVEYREEAVEAALAMVEHRLPGWGPRIDVNVHATQAPLRARLIEKGLGIDSVVLLGTPHQALQQLMDRYAPPANLEHLGLRVARLSTEAEVDAMMALKAEAFTKEPQWCWFGAKPKYLAGERAGHIEELSDPDALRWVVYRGEEVVGSFGSDFQPANNFWGRHGGADLILHESVRGRGIVKTAYRLMMEGLAAKRAQVFKGGTSQAAVMGLGKVMGRALIATHHRRDARLPTSHFELVL